MFNSWEKSHCFFSSCQVLILWNKTQRWKKCRTNNFTSLLHLTEFKIKFAFWISEREGGGSLTCHPYFECSECSSAGPRTASCSLACWWGSSSPPWDCRPGPSARTWEMFRVQLNVMFWGRRVSGWKFENSFEFNFVPLQFLDHFIFQSSWTTGPLLSVYQWCISWLISKDKK